MLKKNNNKANKHTKLGNAMENKAGNTLGDVLCITCTRMSARWVSRERSRRALLSSWMNQDPLLVFLMAAVPAVQGFGA